MIVRPAGDADLAVLVELRELGADQSPTLAAWMAAHAETHLPFVAEVGGDVISAAWLHIGERVPGRDS